MAHKFLNRSDAPFSDKVWEAIDTTVRETGRTVSTVRKVIHTEDPLGFDVRSIPGPDSEVGKESDDELQVSASQSTPVVTIQSSFSLGAREIQGFEENGVDFDLWPVADAAKRCIEKEDSILLNGSVPAGIPGLLTTTGVQKVKLSEWKAAGNAVEDILKGVDKLDAAGFHGPYSLALAPSMYNRLFRKYQDSEMLEMEHVKALVTEGIVKAPALQKGGVLVASDRWYVSIALGQDLLAGFDGPEGREFQFTLSESVGLRMQAPSAICVLE